MKTISAYEVPKTEGIKYAGSKLKLIPHILRLAENTGARSVFDGFSGTTRVSQAFAKAGYAVSSNDTSVWSKTFGDCYLINTRDKDYFEPLIDHLNSLPGKEGWFTENYGGSADSEVSSQEDGLKKPFQIHNMRKLDAIREEIDELPIDDSDRSVLLTSLILALDRVDSTIGHFASYLNRWSKRSYGDIFLKMPNLIENSGRHDVTRMDATEAVRNTNTDLAYFDPPYGSNNEKMPPSRVRYSSYYHFWSTVILNDRPATFGKAKRRQDSSDTIAASIFEEFRKNENGRYLAIEAIEELLAATTAEHVIVSYGSRGRATSSELYEVLESSGEILDFVSIDYRANVMSKMRWTNEWTRVGEKRNQEYLFLIRKS